MPFAFVLPTTSAFSFAAAWTCPTHPSLLHTATTYRGVVRDILKKYKRLPPEAQTASLGLVVASLEDYLPHVLVMAEAIDGSQPPRGKVAVTRTADVSPTWRPTLAPARLPGREPPRVAVPALALEAVWTLTTLAAARVLQARAALQPLMAATTVAPAGPQQRQAAVAAATKQLLAAAQVWDYAATLSESAISSSFLPSVTSSVASLPEIAPPTLRALAALALAEATLLAVLKDDPYPAVIAQRRSALDREWMYKAPDIPKVRAHLFARLCLAAADHASRAHAALAVVPGLATAPIARYVDDLRRTSRAKACRFFAIDADLAGNTGTALAWLQAARQELGHVGSDAATSAASSPFARLKKDRADKHEDHRLARGVGWGADAGRLDESRVLEMLQAKWTKQNDTVNTQPIPPYGPLLAQMPSGREIHTCKPYVPPVLDTAVLEALRAPRDPLDGPAPANDSSDDEPGSSRTYF